MAKWTFGDVILRALQNHKELEERKATQAESARQFDQRSKLAQMEYAEQTRHNLSAEDEDKKRTQIAVDEAALNKKRFDEAQGYRSTDEMTKAYPRLAQKIKARSVDSQIRVGDMNALLDDERMSEQLRQSASAKALEQQQLREYQTEREKRLADIQLFKDAPSRSAKLMAAATAVSSINKSKFGPELRKDLEPFYKEMGSGILGLVQPIEQPAKKSFATEMKDSKHASDNILGWIAGLFEGKPDAPTYTYDDISKNAQNLYGENYWYLHDAESANRLELEHQKRLYDAELAEKKDELKEK